MHYRYFTIEQREALGQAILTRAAEPGMAGAAVRLHTPEYGVCEACGADIPFVRMLSNPRLRRCARCPAES